MKQFFSVISFFILFSISAQTTLTKDTSFSFEFPDEGDRVFFKLYPINETLFRQRVQIAPDNNIYSIVRRISPFHTTILMKSNPDGSLNYSFSGQTLNDGYIPIPVSHGDFAYFMIQSTGKVILVKQASNQQYSEVYRYDLNGNLDSSFGNNGILSGTLDLADKEKPFLLLEDDSFLEIQNNQLIKYNSDGQIDTSYGNNGVTNFIGNPDTKIIGVRGNYVYGSDYAGKFNYFNYTNPTENATVLHPETASNKPHLLNLDENGSFSGLYFSSISATAEKPVSGIFVLNQDLELNSDFYGDGQTHIADYNRPAKIAKIANQYFVLLSEIETKLYSFDESGNLQNINGAAFSLLGWNAGQGYNLTGKDSYLLYEEPEGLTVTKYLIGSDSSAPTCSQHTVWNGTSWSNGQPSNTNAAIIDGNLNLTTNLETCNLKVTSNGNFNIDSDTNVTVHGDVINHNGIFTIQDGANFIQTDNDAAAIGNYTVYKYSQPMKRLDYTLWASPVMGQQLQDFSPETLPNRIYWYDGSEYVSTDPLNDFYMSLGYLFRSPNNWSSTTPTQFLGEFNGVINNGLNYGFYIGSAEYTSVGNPYPSNIDADSFMQMNPKVSTLYFWNNTGIAGSNYATYTSLGGTAAGGGSLIPNGIISVGQGFIVDNNTSSLSDLIFDNSMRVANSAIFFKGNGTDKHRIWLNLNNDQNESLSQALVGYMNGATNEVDAQIDGKMFGNEGSALYNIIGEDKFAIQGRALPFEKSDVVKLGFKAVEAGKFNISLSNFDGLFAEGEVKVYLKDKQLNTTYNLMESDYNFESNAGEFNDRFEIVYEKEVMGTGDLTANSIQIYTQKENIIVNSKSEKINSVELFDLTGRKIHSNNNVNANQYEVETNSKGVIVVKVQAENGKSKQQKVILK